MSHNIPIIRGSREAVITSVGRTHVKVRYTDGLAEKELTCRIPHPLPMLGGGIFAGFEPGIRVIVSPGVAEQGKIVRVVPERQFYFDQSGVADSSIDRPSYPTCKPGELCIQGPTGCRIDLLQDGNITLNAAAGDDIADLQLSPKAKTLFTRTNNINTFTESGRFISGVVKRDKSTEEEEISDATTFNWLTGEAMDSLLTPIGRSPSSECSYRTTTLASAARVRNPAYIEHRSIVYEYANSFGIKSVSEEASSTVSVNPDNLNEDIALIQDDPSFRQNRRYDTLNLNLRNYNHLIEKVEGTVVDIYGNVLDINRNILPIPESNTITTCSSPEQELLKINKFINRSVKYHYEINSRKANRVNEPSTSGDDVNLNNAGAHSRFCIDVDGEGLLKINIPASSETGNIPVLSRYMTSTNPDDKNSGTFRDSEQRDIRGIQFGAKNSKGEFAGQSISNGDYLPKIFGSETGTISAAGTAHHDMSEVASTIFAGAASFSAGSTTGTDKALSLEAINNKIDGEGQNAGGRSVHANLDGSVELSVGADTIDRKSLLLDLAGGIVSHYGKDNRGRSIISQTDGNVIIKIGGEGITNDDSREGADKPFGTKTGEVASTLEIHISKGPNANGENPPHRIIIDPQGMTFDIQGAIVFKSSGNMSLKSDASLNLNGEVASFYGSTDLSTRTSTGEMLVVRSGLPLGLSLL